METMYINFHCLGYVVFTVHFLDPYVSHHKGLKPIWLKKLDTQWMSCSKSYSHFYCIQLHFLLLGIYIICLVLVISFWIVILFASMWHQHYGLFFCFLERCPRSSFISAHMLEIHKLIRKLLSFHSDIWKT